MTRRNSFILAPPLWRSCAIPGWSTSAPTGSSRP